MEWRHGAFTIDTDRQRLDLELIADWLADTYWAGTGPRADVLRSWRASAEVFGLYACDELVGCARVVTDYVSSAYLADVLLQPPVRGQGLGLWLVKTIVNHPELQSVTWLLHTRDASGLYRRVGFTELGSRVMERQGHASSPTSGERTPHGS